MKKNNATLMILFSFLVFLFSSCGGADDADNQQTDSTQAEQTDPEELANLDLSAGKKVYEANCITCHQPQGEGVLGVFPPLANSDYLVADKNRAIKHTMYGSNIPITVNGQEYPGNVMTKDLGLTDEQIKDVINYILNSWGNRGGIVTLENVKAARKK